MYNELNERMQKYLAEFDANGVEIVTVDGIDWRKVKGTPWAVPFYSFWGVLQV